MSDDLRRSLSGIADEVRPADMYERALGRSRRIRRNRIATVSASALVVLGLAGAGMVTLAGPHRPGTPVVAASTGLSPSAGTSPRVTMAVPGSRSLRDLPGKLFYRAAHGGTLVRLTGDGATATVLDKPNQAVAVSPDGTRIAYVSAGRLYVAGSAQPVLDGQVDLGKQFPAWSPDGAKLLVATSGPRVLTVATGAVDTIPGGPKGQDFRWSGDGSRLVYVSGGRVRLTTVGSGSATTVPVLGDENTGRNPEQLAAGIPASVNTDGTEITMRLSGGRDITDGRELPPDTVVNATTGSLEAVRVPGVVQSALFDPRGNLVVRAQDGDGRTLSAFSPSGALLTQAPEPSAVQSLELVAYAS
jgi:TolB protein